MSKKMKRTAQQLIDDVFKPKGITFHQYNERDAIQFLEEKNYYYKFASYRHNFHKGTDDKYINLDFNDLIEISKFDKRLRFLMLRMCLEIEHAVKTNLLKNISYNDDIGGYEIVGQFIEYYNTKNNNKPITKTEIIKRGSNPYSSSHQLYVKLKDEDNIAIWQLVEFLYVSELPLLFEYYYYTYPELLLPFIQAHRMDFPKNLCKEPLNVPAIRSKIISFRTLFKNANAVRNNAAHNNVLLICLNTKPVDAIQIRKHSGDLYVNDKYNNYYLRRYLKKMNLDLNIQASYRFMDLAAVIKLYALFCVKLDDPNVTNLLRELETAKSLFAEQHNDLSHFLKSLTDLANEIFSS